ncbi:hypothetical protein Tco_1388300, partial [Tanacetum coccineum]
LDFQSSGADLDGGVSGGAFDWCGGGSVSSGGGILFVNYLHLDVFFFCCSSYKLKDVGL